jgi:hypothetical protein
MPSDSFITYPVLRRVALLSKSGNSSFCHVAVHVGTWGTTFSESFNLNFNVKSANGALLKREIVGPFEGC